MRQRVIVAVPQILQFLAGFGQHLLIHRVVPDLFEILLQGEDHHHQNHNTADGERPDRRRRRFGMVVPLGCLVMGADSVLVNVAGVLVA